MSQTEAKVEVAIIEMPNPEISGFTAATDVLHASNAETAAFTGSDRDYSRYKSGMLVIDLTAITLGAATGVTFILQGKDPLSGKYHQHVATTSLNAAATRVIYFDESNATLSDTSTEIQAHPLLSTTYRFITTIQGGAITTYTFSAYIMLKPQ